MDKLEAITKLKDRPIPFWLLENDKNESATRRTIYKKTHTHTAKERKSRIKRDGVGRLLRISTIIIIERAAYQNDGHLVIGLRRV